MPERATNGPLPPTLGVQWHACHPPYGGAYQGKQGDRAQLGPSSDRPASCGVLVAGNNLSN
jgi:hypothetical protein